MIFLDGGGEWMIAQDRAALRDALLARLADPPTIHEITLLAAACLDCDIEDIATHEE